MFLHYVMMRLCILGVHNISVADEIKTVAFPERGHQYGVLDRFRADGQALILNHLLQQKLSQHSSE